MAPAEKTWLTVVGIGENGLAGLGDDAKQAIATASHVFGGSRHLELADAAIKGQRQQWPTPFSVDPVVALRGQKVCVLASGDPMLFGVGATLSRRVPAEEMLVLPAPSAFSLAAARMGWPLHEADTISLHGLPIDLIRPLLHPGRRILALTSDGLAPAAIAALLTENGFGGSPVTVLEALGGPRERVQTLRASDLKLGNCHPLNVLAIAVESDAQARILPATSGMPNALFDNDGQLTKREVRAVTLSSLAPARGQLLWDVGAGSGSIAIEWLLAHPSMRAIAVEAEPQRAATIRANASANGVPGLRVVEGKAPEALAGLETPDAIFIGGGGSDKGVLDSAILALRLGGRLVANAVTLEFEQMLLARYAEHGGELIRIAISHAAPVGAMQAWRTAMPITQWIWTKP